MTKAGSGAELPEVGYYTDANGLTWQLSAEDAGRLGYTAPDRSEPATRSASKPVGPPPVDGAPAAQ